MRYPLSPFNIHFCKAAASQRCHSLQALNDLSLLLRLNYSIHKKLVSTLSVRFASLASALRLSINPRCPQPYKPCHRGSGYGRAEPTQAEFQSPAAACRGEEGERLPRHRELSSHVCAKLLPTPRDRWRGSDPLHNNKNMPLAKPSQNLELQRGARNTCKTGEKKKKTLIEKKDPPSQNCRAHSEGRSRRRTALCYMTWRRSAAKHLLQAERNPSACQDLAEDIKPGWVHPLSLVFVCFVCLLWFFFLVSLLLLTLTWKT